MSISLKPGVVSGEDYKTLVNAAKEGQYALPAVNVVGTNSVNAAMEAAANNKSDIKGSKTLLEEDNFPIKIFPDNKMQKKS